MFLAVGLPDLHAGPTCPIGTAVATSRLLYPALVGSDIGCGIRFDQTSLTKAASGRSRVVDRWANAVDLEGGLDGDVEGGRLGRRHSPIFNFFLCGSLWVYISTGVYIYM